MTRCRNPPSKHARKTTEDEPTVFIVRRPYRWVRHPWYLVAIMLFWSSVDFTSDRLLLNVLWTDWVCLGTRLEQIDLVSDFGEVYEKYRRRGRVRMLIPWASSNWDIVRSLSQLLFPPQQFWLRRDSDPVRHQTGSWSILAEVDEFAAPEMKG